MADSSHVDSNVITTATDASGATVISVVQSNVIESSRVDSVITTGGKGEKGDQGDTGPTGATGATGSPGIAGTDGADGVGVPVGGSTGQVLAKNSATDFDTEWVDQTGGGSSSSLVINALDYGAIGDDTTDNSTALQDAIDAANTAGGGTVFMPAGKYKFSTTLVMKSNVNIIGAGEANTKNGTTLNYTSTTGHGLFLELTTADGGWVRLADFNLFAPYAAHTDGVGIFFKITPPGGQRPVYQGVRVERVHVDGFADWGMQADGLIHSSVKDSIFTYNGNGLLLNGDPLETGSSWPLTSTIVEGCYFNWNTNVGLEFRYSEYCAVINCAADHNNVQYRLTNCASVSFYSTGGEYNNSDAPADGITFDIRGTRTSTLYNCYSYLSKEIAVKVSSTGVYDSNQIKLIGYRDTGPASGAVSLVIDANNIASIDETCSFVSITNNGTLYNLGDIMQNIALVGTDLIFNKTLKPIYDYSFNIGGGSNRINYGYFGAVQLSYANGLIFGEGSNVEAGTGTGTKIGTATSQKFGFFNATPVTQRSGNVVTALSQLGLVLSGTIAIADISATGTPSSSTYLRGDGTWATPSGGGGSGTPGGSDTQIQFNDGGAFGGDAGLTYNKTTDTLGTGVLAGNSSGSLILAGGTSGGSGAGIELFNYNTGVLRAGSGYAFQWSGSRFAGGYNLGMDLGDASNYFNNLYAQKHYFNSTASFDGATAGIIKTEADVEITDTTKGVILKSPDGTRWRLTVGNDGAITTTVV